MATGEHLDPPTIDERVDAAKKHLAKGIEWKGDVLGVVEMRRHYTNYFKGYPQIKSYRSKLVQENDSAILFEILEEIRYAYQEAELVS
jgi:tRNA-dihydrouridine synthase